MNQRVYPSPHPEIANSLNNVASTLNALGRSSDALPKYEAALEMKQQLFTGDHAQVAVALHNVAFCLNALGRTAEALPKEEASLEMYQRLFHGDDVAVSGGLNNVASWLNLLGRSAEALPKFQQALEMSQRLAEAQPGNNALKMNVALTHGNLGDLLAKTGNAEGSREQYQQGLQIAEAILASDAANARAAKVRTGLRAKLGFEPSTNSAGSPK
jgi:tetratricopeptide (TPR) repeat protein